MGSDRFWRMSKVFLLLVVLAVAASATFAGPMSITIQGGFGTNRQYGTNYEALVSGANTEVETVGAMSFGAGFRYTFLPWLSAEIGLSVSNAGGGTTNTTLNITSRDIETVAHLPLLAVFSWGPEGTPVTFVGLVGPSALFRIMDARTNVLIIGGVEYASPFGIVYAGVRSYRTLTSMDPSSTAVDDLIYFGGLLFEAGYRLQL